MLQSAEKCRLMLLETGLKRAMRLNCAVNVLQKQNNELKKADAV